MSRRISSSLRSTVAAPRGNNTDYPVADGIESSLRMFDNAKRSRHGHHEWSYNIKNLRATRHMD